MKKFMPITGLLFAILIISYLESPYSLINKEYTQVASIPNEVLLAEDQAATNANLEATETEEVSSIDENEEIAALNYSLEMVLENKTKKDGYIVETYREYEFYRDGNGQVIKKVPTSNENTLRYYDR